MIRNENEIVNDPFKVYVRIRPILEREINLDKEDEKSLMDRDKDNFTYHKNGIKVEDNMIFISDSELNDTYQKKEKCFAFDDVFTEKDDNQGIFTKVVKNLVNNIMNGFNATALAYGVTGTGKTHTMFGDIHINLSLNEKGICTYAVDYLFDMIKNETSKNFLVKINYIEIYNEQVIDLLVDKRQESNDHLMIIEDPVKGVVVPESREYVVSSTEEVMKLIRIGNSRRVMAPTSGNQFSSRSHAILQVIVEQRAIIGGKDEITSSKLLLVDLAGSERGSLEKGIRRDEGANINKSLLALGNCINILSDKHKTGSFVPYRDSKLTRLLKDSLGGNISTIMIACISPSILLQDETINTLKYASRARKIQKKITRNVKEIESNSPQYKELVESLKKEIIQLKEVINNQNILLKYKPVDSFFDGREANNINFNFNNRGNLDSSYKDNQDINNFYNPEMKTKLLFSNSGLVEIPGNKINIINNFNLDVYEEFLKKNFNSLSEEELDDLSKKMERYIRYFKMFELLSSLYFDKISLEEKILREAYDSTTNEKYTIVKMFYEKYIEMVNEKLIENIEHNMILKFNLKEILELNQINNINLNNLIKQIHSENLNEEEIRILVKEKEDLENIIKDNEKEKEEIGISLEKNLKLKKIFRELLIKFISNTQIKEIKDLREAYISIENDKKELELKNKKYQEFLNSVLKEKDDYEKKLNELKRELEHTKKNLAEKEKKLSEADRKIRDLNFLLKNELNQSTKQVRYNDHSRISSISRKYFSNKEFSHRIHPNKKLNSSDNILNSSRKYSVNSINRGITNNYININVTSKIPRVTAILQNGNLITTSVSNIDFTHNSTAISKLKKNLNVDMNSQSTKNLIQNNRHKLKTVSNSKIKFENMPGSIKNTKNKIIPISRDSNSQKQNSKDILNNIRINLNSDKCLNANYTTVAPKMEKDKIKSNNNLDSFSISAVSVNNDVCLNSSVLEIMESVLNLDGIKNQRKNIEAKSITYCANNTDNLNFINEFLKRNKFKEEPTSLNVNKLNEKNEIFSNRIKENNICDDIFNRALLAVKGSGTNRDDAKEIIKWKI